jgi:hypothetical protein
MGLFLLSLHYSQIILLKARKPDKTARMPIAAKNEQQSTVLKNVGNTYRKSGK